MDVFFYELIFFLFALIIRIVPIVLLAALAVWCCKVVRCVCGRISEHCREKREREARKVIYRRRSELYRRRCGKCYRQE